MDQCFGSHLITCPASRQGLQALLSFLATVSPRISDDRHPLTTGRDSAGPCLIEDKVVQPSRPLGQQPGSRLAARKGVAHQCMAEHPAAVLVKRCDVEVHRAGVGLVWRDIPAWPHGWHHK